MKARIALVYDRVNTVYGGAEQVILALQKIYPEATLYTSIYDQKKARWARSFSVKTSFLQKIPLATRIHRYLAALMPLAFESLDLSDYEIVISVTSAEAKSIITRRDQLHFCYLLSPPRYLYHYRDEYLKKNHLLNLPIIKGLAQFALNYLYNFDQIAIFRPDVIVPIAQIVEARAKKYYPNLKTEPVIYPPINSSLLKYQSKKNTEDNFLLLVSRLVPYKNIDAAILACQKLQINLVIVGEGPEESKLKKMANQFVTFKQKIKPEELAFLYQHCQAVLSPGIDDFGIVALEANLFGKAVIINQLSGAAELIEDQKHGLHLTFSEGDQLKTITDNLVNSIKKLEKIQFDPKILRKNALKYDTNRFVRNFDQALQKAYSKFIV